MNGDCDSEVLNLLKIALFETYFRRVGGRRALVCGLLVGYQVG